MNVIQMNKRLLLLIIVTMLSACQQKKDDLTQYVAEIKAQQKSDIPPIPVMKPYEKFEYAAADLRDPFIPTVKDMPEPKTAQGNGVTPDSNRRKEALEFYDLGDLQYVGTLEKDEVWALIRSSDGVIHRVQTGNYMGENYGKIVSIADNKLTLQEIVPNGAGGFIERNTTVSSVETN